MRTLHFGLRVADLERSLAFYTAVGYEVIGSVPETAFGLLTMLKLPDDDFVTIELVYDPTKGEVDFGSGLNHFVIKVESSWSSGRPVTPTASPPPTGQADVPLGADVAALGVVPSAR